LVGKIKLISFEDVDFLVGLITWLEIKTKYSSLFPKAASVSINSPTFVGWVRIPFQNE
jgi:hypothetical protein